MTTTTTTTFTTVTATTVTAETTTTTKQVSRSRLSSELYLDEDTLSRQNFSDVVVKDCASGRNYGDG